MEKPGPKTWFFLFLAQRLKKTLINMSINTHRRFCFERILLYFLFLHLSNTFYSNAQEVKPAVHLNQVGFYPAAPKIAIVSPVSAERSFSIIDKNSGKRILTGQLSEPVLYKFSGLTASVADFSSVTREGEYYIVVEGVEKHYPFEIKKEVHKDVLKTALKSYYLTRASTGIYSTYGRKWARPLAHPDNEIVIHASAASANRPEGTIINVSKGWYDAGDYNKYIVNSGITMGTMLSLYEEFPDYFKKLNTDIPESSNKIPDLLDELLWNLRWMLAMQDPNDGGVYHKCTEAKFSAFVMPEKLTQKRYVVQKSTAATLDFAAVAAQAARILLDYKKELPGLADSCINASKKAWEWAGLNPHLIYDQQGINDKYDPDITTGAYPGHPLNDEWTWAASELYVTTGNKDFLDKIHLEVISKFNVPSWGQVNMLGYFSILRNKKKLKEIPQQQLKNLENRLIHFADSLSEISDKPFKTVMGNSEKDFIWGSNAVAANQGFCLIEAYLQNPKKAYLQGALTNLDYILGRNATGFCFLTGFGEKSTMHPHHRISESDSVEEPIPGLLAGGPNPGQQDKCKYPSNLPALSYSDTQCSYASNETAINWNSPFVYLTGALEALVPIVRF
jgi:endoglucanase